MQTASQNLRDLEFIVCAKPGHPKVLLNHHHDSYAERLLRVPVEQERKDPEGRRFHFSRRPPDHYSNRKKELA